MKRWFVPIMAVIVLLALPVSGAATVLKIATIAPEGTFWMKKMRQGAGEIAERTKGRVKFKFYGGGVMGNDKSVLRKIRVRQLHGGAFTAGGLANVYPSFALYSMPLMFRSLDEVDAVRSEMDGKLAAGLEEQGFVSFGLAQGGMALLMSTKPADSIEKLKGLKVWVPEGDRVSYIAMESIGLSPVTLPLTDVLTGLQTGLVEVVAVSPLGAIAFQWHTRLKYVAKTPLAYLYATLAIERKSFEKLSEEDRAVVREVFERTYQELHERNGIYNDSAHKTLQDQGLKIVTPEPAEVERWRAAGREVFSRIREEGRFSSELMDEMSALLEAFREQKDTP